MVEPERVKSHTLVLIQEALAAAEAVAALHHIERLKAGVVEPRSPQATLPDFAGHRFTKLLNRLAAIVGLHVSRSAYLEALQSSVNALEGSLQSALGSFGYDLFIKWTSLGTLESALGSPVLYDSAYECLEDDASRSLFDWFVRARVAYATIGEQALTIYPASISRDRYAGLIHSLGRRGEEGYRVGKWVIDSMPEAIVDSVLSEQYCLPGVVEPQDGDTVLDIGAYKGETALWFADRIGSKGLVLALEPGPQANAVLRQNVNRNQLDGAAPIRVLPCAAGACEETAPFIASAECGSVLGIEGSSMVAVTTIDALTDEQRLERVDFIKMDIEGGEVDALRGAQETLTKFAPRLAISVYHRPRDLPDIVAIVRQARPDYRLYLSHKSPGLGDTILFAHTPL